LKYLIFLLFVLFSSTPISAQYSFSGTVNGTINVTSIQSMSITGGTSLPNFVTLDDYFNGVEMSNYVTIMIKSNISWLLGVQAQNDFFTPMSQGGSTNMPSTVLGLKTNSQINFTSVTTNSFTVKTGNKGNSTNTGNTFNLDMKFNPGFNYKGGIYAISLMYTLTAQ